MATIARGNVKRPAFTMADLLIVIVIVALILGIVIPLIQHARENAARTACMNNLKQMGLGVQNFQSTFGRAPPLYGGSDGAAVQNSLKYRNDWASTHVFLKPYIDQDGLYKSLGSPSIPPVIDPTLFPSGAPAITMVVYYYVCPSDPTVSEGIIIGGKFGGTSYAANAQVFAPLADESLNGGTMYPAEKPDFTDRGTSLEKIKDGSSNTIIFTHSYAVCGSPNTGTVWGYGAGVNKPPSPIISFQPWSRASYLGQTYMTLANGYAFQDRPNPYLTECKVTDPASPHPGYMLVGMADGGVRSVSTEISPSVWNKACLPNDGTEMGKDW